MRYPPSLIKLVEELKKLPGIGPINAQRLAFFLLRAPNERAESLAAAMTEMKRVIVNCSRCFNLSEKELCEICSNPDRDSEIMCVVQLPQDLFAIESTGQFRGTYHVLAGALSPMRGVGPEDIRIGELVDRIKKEGTKELIVATNLDVEGEATASYIAGLVKSEGVKVTRIARGIPIGGSLEHADTVTIGLSIDGRQEL
ncbi:recombination protein RecR [bacterium]|nr:recombination protein RecR [bacterium]